ncbi:hypothetical protein BD779DRAFT_1474187 [Infundibulicybe gibba]|nr:hypothetical protein BD779DRAFT_1474187 [Infundibulicybe gibba]
MTTVVFVQCMKHPMRGGKNLTQRYQILEWTLRGKRAQHAQGEQNQTFALSSSTATGLKHPSTITRAKGTGLGRCAICMYNHNALEQYNALLTRFQASLAAVRVPEAEWLPQPRAAAETESGAGGSTSAPVLRGAGAGVAGEAGWGEGASGRKPW